MRKRRLKNQPVAEHTLNNTFLFFTKSINIYIVLCLEKCTFSDKKELSLRQQDFAIERIS